MYRVRVVLILNTVYRNFGIERNVGILVIRYTVTVLPVNQYRLQRSAIYNGRYIEKNRQ